MKITLKDKRILGVLDRDPNISLSQLGKEVRLSPQVVDYRINRLLKQNTIYSFYTLIDAAKLGFSSYRIHMRLKNINKKTQKEFAEKLFVNYPTFWVGYISGSFDLIIDIFAKDSNHFVSMITDIVKKNKAIVESYESLRMLHIDFYTYGYFIENKSIREGNQMLKEKEDIVLDKTDRKVLTLIKYNSRIKTEEIARTVGLTRNAVKHRIQKMEKKRIICGYKCIVNFNHLSKLSYKIFIRYNTAYIDQEAELLNYLKSVAGIFDTVKLMGEWDLDIEIHVKDARELQQFIIDMRNKFSIIQNYEIAQILDDYGIDFFPEKIN